MLQRMTYTYADKSGLSGHDWTVSLGWAAHKPNPRVCDVDDAVVLAVDGEKPADRQAANEAFDLLLSTDWNLRYQVELAIRSHGLNQEGIR